MVRRKRAREQAPSEMSARRLEPVAVPRGASRVTVDDDARALGLRLLAPGRSWPVAVVTIASGQTEPFVDVDELADALRGLVEIVVMPTSDVSWAFSSVMPPQTQVYGGASRVYPVADGWVSRPRTAPLRFAYSTGERQTATEHLIADGMAAAVAAGLYSPRSTSPDRRVAGQVLGIVGARALVRLDNGSPATLWEELSGYDVPLDRLVRTGQLVQGDVDPETGRLVLDPAEPPTWPDGYGTGTVVLAEVVGAGRDALTLQAVDGIDCVVDRSAVTGNDNDRLDALFSQGDVVVARVVDTDPPALSLLDIDDDERPVVAPPILEGGPPWLLLPAAPQLTPIEEPDEPTSSDEAVRPEPPGANHPVAHGPDPVVVAPSPPPSSRPPTPLDVLSGRAVPPLTPSSPRATPVPSGPSGTAVRDLSLSLQTARARIERLEGELTTARGAAHELAQMREHSRTLAHRLAVSDAERKAFRLKYRDADRARQRLERAANAHSGDDDTRAWFTTTEDALRFAVTAAWAARVPSGEKARWPLRQWRLGPAFDDSLTALAPVSWHKLAEVVCDVVVGDPQRLRALDHHELRTGASGGTPAVTREDGATCFRVALQRNSPSARRLHYWRVGECIELSRVVLHDDMTP